MENLMFVLWLLGWPIVCTVADKFGGWEFVKDNYEQSTIAFAAVFRVLVWLGVGVLLYRQ
jgi:hypothetical protein